MPETLAARTAHYDFAKKAESLRALNLEPYSGVMLTRLYQALGGGFGPGNR